MPIGKKVYSKSKPYQARAQRKLQKLGGIIQPRVNVPKPKQSVKQGPGGGALAPSAPYRTPERPGQGKRVVKTVPYRTRQAAKAVQAKKRRRSAKVY